MTFLNFLEATFSRARGLGARIKPSYFPGPKERKTRYFARPMEKKLMAIFPSKFGDSPRHSESKKTGANNNFQKYLQFLPATLAKRIFPRLANPGKRTSLSWDQKTKKMMCLKNPLHVTRLPWSSSTVSWSPASSTAAKPAVFRGEIGSVNEKIFAENLREFLTHETPAPDYSFCRFFGNAIHGSPEFSFSFPLMVRQTFVMFMSVQRW